jgi:hypothetical protein
VRKSAGTTPTKPSSDVERSSRLGQALANPVHDLVARTEFGSRGTFLVSNDQCTRSSIVKRIDLPSKNFGTAQHLRVGRPDRLASTQPRDQRMTVRPHPYCRDAEQRYDEHGNGKCQPA